MKKLLVLPGLLIAMNIVAFSQRQDVMDDGFTWFESVATTENTGVNNAPVATGWMLKIWARALGNYPNRSALKFVVVKAGKPIATTRCEAGVYRKSGNDVDESFMRTAECWQKASATKETGNLDVQVYAINGETLAEKLLRTYKIDVRAINQVPSGQQPGAAPPHYMIMRHAEAPVSFMFLRPSGYTSYFDVADRPERSGANLVELHYSLSPSEEGRNLPYGNARCTVNGKLLSLPGPSPYNDQITSSIERFTHEIYQDRIAPKYKAGMEYRDEMRFQMVRVHMPLTWGSVRDTNRLALEDYPGNWECSYNVNGAVYRTWRWKVGADGRIETHPEQKGNVSLGYNTYLVEMDIPAGGSALDKRLVPGESLAKGLFYGIPWTSAEGKAMAARVPKKGEPFSLPSNMVK
jgi:hypothetical protein